MEDGPKNVAKGSTDRWPWKLPSSRWNLLFALVLLLYVCFFYHRARVDSAIADRQRTCEGTVAGRDDANRTCYQYVFAVEGQKFGGCDFPPSYSAAGDESDRSAGESQVLVYYDPADPANNNLIGFRAKTRNDRLDMAFVSAFLPLLLLSVLISGKRAQRLASERRTRDSSGEAVR